MILSPATPGPATSEAEEERQPGPVCAPSPSSVTHGVEEEGSSYTEDNDFSMGAHNK